MSPRSTKVLLLREPSTPDKYESTFISAGYNPISVPVLETLPVNLPALRDIIRDGPEACGLAGVVITSKRSCETWGMALDILKEGEQDEESLLGWSKIPFYVIGQGTATALQNAFGSFSFNLDIRGQSSGNATALAPFMLSDIKQRPAKILYLTGDKNRDTLTNLLTEGGISLHALQVYETVGSPRFEEQLACVLDDPPKECVPPHWWIVYFAPSAAAFVTPILQKYFDLEKKLRSPTVTTKNSRRAKVAAIGPTTNTFLLDNLGMRVHAMAHKPTPEEILAVIDTEDRTT